MTTALIGFVALVILFVAFIVISKILEWTELDIPYLIDGAVTILMVIVCVIFASRTIGEIILAVARGNGWIK